MKILLVDDDTEVRTSLAELLTVGGHQVTAVADGQEALTRIGESHFDQLVTDLEMPGLDGVALIREVRRKQPELTAILVSSHPNAAEQARRLNLTAVAKPCNGPTLLAAVENAHPLAALQDQLPSPDLLSTLATGTEASELTAAGPSQARLAAASTSHRGKILQVVVLLVLSLGLIRFFAAEPPPELPELQNAGVVRGSVTDVLEPSGPQFRAPGRLRWSAPESAVRFRVVFERVDGQVIFQQEIDRLTDSDGAHFFDLPSDFATSLQPMVVYNWWVESLTAEGSLVSRSQRERFRILADIPSSSTGDSI